MANVGAMSAEERGRRLARLREEAGLLQRQVGAEFDIDKASVSAWETGKTRPDIGKLARLDVLYKADGAVLALFGVSTTPLADDVAGLQAAMLKQEERIAVLAEQLARLQAQVARLDDTAARVESPGRRPGVQSAGGQR